jgi:tetratricopeptide (TPR) repeat protein
MKNLFKLFIAIFFLIITFSCNEYYAEKHYEQGKVMLDKGNYKEAIELFNKAAKKNPNDYFIFSNRAISYYNLEDYNSALKDFNRALEIQPNRTFALYWRGNTYEKLSNYKLALSDYESLIRLNDSDGYLGKALFFHNNNFLDSAIIYYNKYLEINPNDYKVINWRGHLYRKLKKFQSALIDYTNYSKISPDCWSFNNIGNIHRDFGNYKEAINNYNIAISYNIGDATPYANRGYTYFFLNDYENAMKDFNKALKLDSESVYAYYRRGKLKLSLNDYRGALIDCDKAIKVDSLKAEPYYYRGIAKQKLNYDKSDFCLDWSKAGELEYFEAYELINNYCQ